MNSNAKYGQGDRPTVKESGPVGSGPVGSGPAHIWEGQSAPNRILATMPYGSEMGL